MHCSAKMISNAIKYVEKVENRGGKRKTSLQDDRKILRLCREDPFKSARQIRAELNRDVCDMTVRRRLLEGKMSAYSPRKKPLLTKKHRDRRLQFARKYFDWPADKWRNILWTDESKIVLYGGTGSRQYVRRPPGTACYPNYTVKTVKHGGSKILIWGCFSYYGVGPIYKIDGIMDQHAYVDILENVMLPYSKEEMPLKWVFQQDNDPKHTSRKAKEWFCINRITVMEWPAQSPDLNPIEHLWGDIKKAVYDAKPTNNGQLWEVVQRAWLEISAERCQHLVDSMPRRCEAVIRNMGNATKY